MYASRNNIRMIKSRRMIWAGHAARVGQKRNAYGILVESPEGKRLLGTPSYRGEDSINKGLKQVAGVGMDWIHTADRDE
jgi:hypothetical protein